MMDRAALRAFIERLREGVRCSGPNHAIAEDVDDADTLMMQAAMTLESLAAECNRLQADASNLLRAIQVRNEELERRENDEHPLKWYP